MAVEASKKAKGPLGGSGFSNPSRIAFLVIALLAAGFVFVWFWVIGEVQEELAEDNDEQSYPSRELSIESDALLDCIGLRAESDLCKERQQAISALKSFSEALSAHNSAAAQEWGGMEYEQALSKKESGDIEYEAEYFSRARDLYNEAIGHLERLFAEVEISVLAALEEGDNALGNERIDDAISAYNQALSWQPDNPSALNGLQRAGLLRQLHDIIRRGSSAESRGNLSEAREAYQDALELDPDYSVAKKHLLAVQRQMLAVQRQNENIRSRRAITAGYQALNSGNMVEARAAFENALSLVPDSIAAKDGLRNAQEHLVAMQVDRLTNNANSALGKEDWNTALRIFDQILATSRDVSTAIEGRAQVARYVSIEGELDRLLARPDRLTSEAVREEALHLLSLVELEDEIGRRIQNKAYQLANYLEANATLVSITVLSDGRTDIELLRTGGLGRFQTKTLSLPPGKYTIMGTRKGYKTVREVLDVAQQNQNLTITVQCIDRL